jgi:HSP20 family molecular chaperone IbpA
VTALLPEARSVRLRETDRELVVEVEVPPGTELPDLTAHLRDGVLTISLPRSPERATAASAPSP